MDKAKYGVLAAGALGIVGAFLPIMMGVSLIDMIGLDAVQGILTLAGYLVGLVVGIIGLSKPFTRPLAITATVFFALSFIKTLDAFSGEIGGKLLFIAALIGLVSSIMMIVKPEEG